MNDLHVIFGAGAVGRAVANELLQTGKRVRLINRSGAADVPPTVETMIGNASSEDFAREACRGAAVIYQCAAPPYHEWAEKFPLLQRSILAAAAANDAVFVNTGNLYLYGEVNGVMTEDTPAAAQTKKGRVRAALEAELFEAHRAGKVRATSVRGSDFYGPQATNAILGERVFPAILSGKTASVVGDPDQPHTFTYIEDFGKAMVNVGGNERAWGEAWHVPNAPTLTTREVLEKAFALAGKKSKISAMSKFMLRLGGLFIPQARESVEMVYQFEKPFVVSHQKYAALFGDHATSHDEGLRRTLDWYESRLQSSEKFQ